MRPEIAYSLSVLYGLNGAQKHTINENIYYGTPEKAPEDVKIIFRSYNQ
jgi:hypothetical protein